MVAGASGKMPCLGAFVAPGKNRVKDMRISVETAVLMALAQGMKVAGYGGPGRG